MVRRQTDDLKDDAVREHVESLQQEQQAIPLELAAVPTESAPLLEDSEEGTFESVLYKRVGNTIYVITPGSTIDIT